MPFLPGDSLLFIVGALCGAGLMSFPIACAVLLAAAVLGDQCNYTIGRYFGPKVFQWPDSRWFNRRAFEQAHAFYVRYGGITIVLARFMPFIRTFAPFVAGVAEMHRGKFTAYNVGGALLWVLGICTAGYFFGNFPWVQANLDKIIWALILCLAQRPLQPPQEVVVDGLGVVQVREVARGRHDHGIAAQRVRHVLHPAGRAGGIAVAAHHQRGGRVQRRQPARCIAARHQEPAQGDDRITQPVGGHRRQAAGERRRMDGVHVRTGAEEERNDGLCQWRGDTPCGLDRVEQARVMAVRRFGLRAQAGSHQHQAAHPSGRQQCQFRAPQAARRQADHGELVDLQGIEHGQHVTGQGLQVVRTARQRTGRPVAPEIGRDHAIAARQGPDLGLPHRGVPQIAVAQQDGGPPAAVLVAKLATFRGLRLLLCMPGIKQLFSIQVGIDQRWRKRTTSFVALCRWVAVRILHLNVTLKLDKVYYMYTATAPN
ncbi:hypothetical protein OsI_21534 [Oryza sativa Indica Group]|uniref:VTT domain-containing protein n=1 Tax=Oryza sativa subsp. indica TaxID=39946 RepID=B8B2A1_ORYSI|nr:hypothetical protein OsI_21534 [Oryza sativa Indica Group]